MDGILAHHWHEDEVSSHTDGEHIHEVSDTVVSAWTTCFPNFHEDTHEKAPDTEINAEWLIHHLDVL